VSETNDLSDAFGAPARTLSAMLPPRRRRAQGPVEHDSPEHGTQEQVARPQSTVEQGIDTPDPDVPHHESSRVASPDEGDAAGTRAVLTAVSSVPEVQHRDEPPAPVAPPAAAATEPPTEGRTGAGAAAPVAKRRRSGRPQGDDARRGLAELEPDTSYQVPVYLHPAAKAAATARRKEHKLTNAEIAFDSIDAVQHRLDRLIADRRHRARPDNSLFPGRTRRGRLNGGGAANAAGDARRVLWGFRATGDEVAVIDRLVTRSGAESRSELVAVALEEALLAYRATT